MIASTFLTKPEVITAIVTAIGGAIAAWWGWKKSRVASAEQQQAAFYNSILAECTSLRQECTDLRKMVGTLQSRVYELQQKLEFYEENHLASEAREMLSFIVNNHDQPMWVHAVGINRWYVNDAYCKAFNVRRKSFWTPINIYARYRTEDLIAYTNHDVQVVEAGTSVDFVEVVRRDVMNPNSDEFVKGTFRKAPLTIGENRYVVGQLIGELEPADEK